MPIFSRWCRRVGLFAFGILLLVRLASASGAPSNIVLMFIDNVGYGDLGCYGNAEVKTPRIDELASQGVRCTDFYIGSPSCMPSRGALLTGRHPIRNGLNEQIFRIDEHDQVGLPRSEVILPWYLKKAGYASGCFGKWNLGFSPGSRPTDRGFDEYFGNISGNCDYYSYVYNGRNDLYHNTEPASADGYSTSVFAEKACQFIRGHKDGPFLCYVPFNAAHFPNPKNKETPAHPAIWQAPDAAFARYGYSPDTRDVRQRYFAVLTALDDGVGRVLDEIDRQGLTKSTLVILLSDNGAFLIPGRGLNCASNEPLKGGGTDVWEGGIRIPCVVRWPGRIAAGSVCREPLWSLDFVPMALAAAGLELPTDRVLEGKDPTAALCGQAPSPHEFMCWEYGSRARAIRQGRYKLIKADKARTSEWQLFDLSTDLGETYNLAAEMPERVQELEMKFDRWRADAETGR